MTPPDTEPELIRAKDAAKKLGKHPRTLDRWSARGILPPPIRLGPGGQKHYKRALIEALIETGHEHE